MSASDTRNDGSDGKGIELDESGDAPLVVLLDSRQ